jgi:hypothetical protein
MGKGWKRHEKEKINGFSLFLCVFIISLENCFPIKIDG